MRFGFCPNVVNTDSMNWMWLNTLVSLTSRGSGFVKVVAEGGKHNGQDDGGEMSKILEEDGGGLSTNFFMCLLMFAMFKEML